MCCVNKQTLQKRAELKKVKQHGVINDVFQIYLWKNIVLDSDWDIRHINIDIYTILFHKYKIIYKGRT